MKMPRIPKHLYKYRSFSVNTLRMLDSAEVYYADPNEFNDPLDCSPTIAVDIDVKSLERLLYKMLVTRYDDERARSAIGQHRDMATEVGDWKTEPEATDYYLRRMASHVDDLLCQELGLHGVFSLAGKWNCPLMWSHYADEHRGICIEYSLSKTNFTDLRPVSYNSPRAIRASAMVDWKLHGKESARQQILSTFFFSKSPQWRYEREWRDVSNRIGSDSAPARISAIHFGMRCDATVVKTILQLYVNSNEPVIFYQLGPVDDSFRLRRYRMEPNEYASGVRLPGFLIFENVLVDDSAGLIAETGQS